MIESQNLIEGQTLKVNLEKVRDRLPKNIFEQLTIDPCGKLVGYKMVDGNSFGLVLELTNGNKSWFFEDELSEVSKD